MKIIGAIDIRERCGVSLQTRKVADTEDVSIVSVTTNTTTQEEERHGAADKA